MMTAQLAFNVTVPSEMADDGEVRFTLIASSVEVSNGSEVTTATSVTASMCSDRGKGKSINLTSRKYYLP